MKQPSCLGQQLIVSKTAQGKITMLYLEQYFTFFWTLRFLF